MATRRGSKPQPSGREGTERSGTAAPIVSLLIRGRQPPRSATMAGCSESTRSSD